MAWAKANRVTPPVWFLQRIADQALVASLKSNSTDNSLEKTAVKKPACCCCHCDELKIAVEKETPELPRKTIAVRTTIQQLLGCQGKHELMKKQIVFILAAAPQPAAQLRWQNLPIVSESSSNFAVRPPMRPS